MDARFPLTDKAGTIGWVRRAPDVTPEAFHHFWDDIVSRPGDDWAGADSIAQDVEALPPLTVVEPKSLKARYRLWVRESEDLAAGVAYQGPGLEESPRRATAPILSAEYVGRARALSEQRVGQAGARLADTLAALLGAD